MQEIRLKVYKPEITKSGSSTKFYVETEKEWYSVKNATLRKFGISSPGELHGKTIKCKKSNINIVAGWSFIDSEIEILDDIEEAKVVLPIVEKPISTKKVSTRKKETQTKTKSIKLGENINPFSLALDVDEEDEDEESYDIEVESEDVVADFDWRKIDYKYLNDESFEKQETISLAKNKSMQNLLNQAFEQNNFATYYRTVAKSRAIDATDFEFFKNSGVEEFLMGTKATLVIDTPKQISEKDEMTADEVKEKYYPNFITKKTLESYANEKISFKEVAIEINSKLISRFKSIKLIARQAEELRVETGSWSLFIAWPFVEGNLNGTPIRSPFMYTPISVDVKSDKYVFTKIEGESFKINAHLIYAVYAEERKIPSNIKINFDNIKSIFVEYLKHGIRIKGQLGDFSSFETIRKEDFELGSIIGEYTMKNSAIFENIIKSEDIYNDFTRIFKDFGDVSIPKDNKDLFGEAILDYPLLPYDVDNNKNMVISAALEDSLTIFGPPGTGKSEVITTILAQAASEQFKNMVVAEKDTALSVLVERLDKKYGISEFVLKLNGSEMQSKNEFWEKITNIIGLLSHKFVEEDVVMPENEFNQFQEEYIKFVDFLVDECNFDKSTIQDELGKFWELVEESQQIREILGETNRYIEQDVKIFKDNVNAQRLVISKINSISERISELDVKTELISAQKQELMNKIYEVLSPPLCYLPKSVSLIKTIFEEKDDKELFKLLSAKHYNVFQISKEFKNNHASILSLRELVIKFMELQPETKMMYIDSEKEKIVAEKNKLESELRSLSLIVPTQKIDEIDNLLDIDDDKIRILGKIEKAYNEFYSKDFDDPQKEFENFKRKMSLVYRKNKTLVKSRIINSMREQIENDDDLKIQYTKVKAFAQYSSQKSKLKPIETVKKFFPIIQTFFPMILSTPSEVSRILPNDPDIFDYGIFDEASQMFLERAMPSIHRCKKVIIAGDEHQLSPSAFFTTRNDVDFDMDDIDVEDIQNAASSLLDWGKSKYRAHMLIRHYRSSNAKLIEYSNVVFYGGKLEALDTPKAEATPVQLIQVNGEWDKKTKINEVEAEKAIQLSRDLFEKYNSVGIITMNRKQTDYIVHRIENDPEFSELFKYNSNWKTNAKQGKTLFVKNIENVQGDESDAIVFSLCYAPDDNGKMTLPTSAFLTKNRLNVAITRAKHKMYVVSSFKSSDVGNTSDVRRLLFKWMSWLQDNALDKKASTLRDKVSAHENEFRSDFEERFYEMLVERLPENLMVRANYISNNYEIDIVIFDTEKEKFVGAIELDGKAFHSSAEQRVIDHDKTVFLEDLGWNIVRVWSTPFWKEPEQTVERTIKLLNLK